jgi:hypothetical protein
MRQRIPQTHATAKRPIGISLLSLALGWLALAGFLSAVVFIAPSGIRKFLELAAPGGRLWLFAGAVLYGTTAAAASVGLWRMAPWALRAFVLWTGSVALLVVLMMITPPWSMVWSMVPWWQYLLSLMLFGGVLGLLGLYIRQKVSPVGEEKLEAL